MSAESSLSSVILAQRLSLSAVENSIASSVGKEVSRAMDVELSIGNSVSSVSSSLGTERSRAVNVETSLGSSVASETGRAVSVEGSISLSVSHASAMLAAETNRAMGVESSLALDEAEVSSGLNVVTSAIRNYSTYGQIFNPGFSCWDIHHTNPSATASGVYYITTGPVYCEMTSLFGNPGWTLVAMISDSSSDQTWAYNSPLWTSSTTANPHLTDITQDENMKNEAFNSLGFNQIRFVFGNPSPSNVGFSIPVVASNAVNLFNSGTLSTSFARIQFDSVLQSIWGSSAVNYMSVASFYELSDI